MVWTIGSTGINSMNTRALIGAILNFFLLGPGYFLSKGREILAGGLTVGAGLSTYVELNLRTAAPELFLISFVAFFIFGTVCAIDGYKDISKQYP